MKNIEINFSSFQWKKTMIAIVVSAVCISMFNSHTVVAMSKAATYTTRSSIDTFDIPLRSHDEYFYYKDEHNAHGKNGKGTITAVKGGLHNTDFNVDYTDFYNYTATGEIQQPDQWLKYAMNEYTRAKQKNKINTFVLPTRNNLDVSDTTNAFGQWQSITYRKMHPTTFSSTELKALQTLQVPVVFHAGDHSFVYDYSMSFQDITKTSGSFKPSVKDQVTNTQLTTYLKAHNVTNAYAIEVNKGSEIIPGVAHVFMRTKGLADGSYNLYSFNPNKSTISYAGRAIQQSGILDFKTNKKGLFFLTKEKTSKVMAKGYTGVYDGKAHSISLSAYPAGSTVSYKVGANGTWTTKKPTRTQAGSATIYFKIEHPSYRALQSFARISISKKSLAAAKVSGIVNKPYTGQPIKQSPVVTLGTTTLKNGRDYKVAYANNVAVGSASMIILGAGNYSGTIYKSFTITKSNVAKLSVSGLVNKAYTGKTIKPAITVKNGKTTLKSGKNYTITYGKNTAVGIGTVKITGKGNYTGSVTKTFQIVPVKPTVSIVPGNASLKITAKAKGAGSYQIAYATSAKGKLKYVTSGTSKTLKLSRNKTYYVKVRAYKIVGNKKCYSSYSTLRCIRTK